MKSGPYNISPQQFRTYEPLLTAVFFSLLLEFHAHSAYGIEVSPILSRNKTTTSNTFACHSILLSNCDTHPLSPCARGAYLVSVEVREMQTSRRTDLQVTQCQHRRQPSVFWRLIHWFLMSVVTSRSVSCFDIKCNRQKLSHSCSGTTPECFRSKHVSIQTRTRASQTPSRASQTPSRMTTLYSSRHAV
jgi:hypothetical protein